MRPALLGLALATLVFLAGCGGDATSPDEPARPAAAAEAKPRAAAASHARVAAPRAEGNGRPVITSLRFEPEHPGPGGSLRAVAEVSDPDADPIELSYTWRLNGKLLGVNGDSVALADARKGDAVEVTVSAGDGLAVSAARVVSVQIQNRPPELRAVRLVPDDGVPPGGRLYVVTEVFDADGDPVELSYTWRVNGATVPGDAAELKKRVGHGDFVSVRVVANDGENDGEPFQLPEVRIENAAPRIVSEPGAPGPDGVFRYRVAAEDVDNDIPLRFSLEQTPDGMTVNERTGLVEWTPSDGQSGRHTIEIAVHDSRGASGTQRFELVVGDETADDDDARQGG